MWYNDIYTPLQDASESLMLTDVYNLSCMLPLPFAEVQSQSSLHASIDRYLQSITVSCELVKLLGAWGINWELSGLATNNLIIPTCITSLFLK